MFAVVKTGGKQYKVQENQTLSIEKVAADAGETFSINEVLMHGTEGGNIVVGAPLVSGCHVECEVLSQYRDKKVIIFKMRRRKHYKRKTGHRQYLTKVKVTKIVC